MEEAEGGIAILDAKTSFIGRRINERDTSYTIGFFVPLMAKALN